MSIENEYLGFNEPFTWWEYLVGGGILLVVGAIGLFLFVSLCVGIREVVGWVV